MKSILYLLGKKALKPSSIITVLAILLVPIIAIFCGAWKADILIPGFIVIFPILYGLLSITSTISQQKQSVLIKRIGQTGITRHEFFLAYFIFYMSIFMMVFFINLGFLGIFSTFSNEGYVNPINFGELQWGVLIFGYVFLCIMIITTSFLIVVIFRDKNSFMLITTTLLAVYILVLSGAVVQWNLIFNEATIPAPITIAQNIMPWSLVSRIVIDSCLGGANNTDIMLVFIIPSLLSAAFYLLYWNFFTFEKYR